MIEVEVGVEVLTWWYCKTTRWLEGVSAALVATASVNSATTASRGWKILVWSLKPVSFVVVQNLSWQNRDQKMVHRFDAVVRYHCPEKCHFNDASVKLSAWRESMAAFPGISLVYK